MSGRHVGLVPWPLAVFVLMSVGAIVVWPQVATVWSSLPGSESASGGGGGLLDAAAFANEVEAARGPAVQTMKVVAGTELVAMPLGLVLAVLLFKTDVPGRKWLIGLVAMGLFVPLPMYAAGWLGSYGNAGRSQALGSAPWLVGWTGAAFVHAMAATPWVVLLTGLGLRSVEPELEESAWMDRPGWWVLIFLSLRRSLGAVLAAALAVAVLTAGDMTVTDLLQVRTYAEEAYVQYGLGRSPAEVARVAIVPTMVLGGLVLSGLGWLAVASPARVLSAGSRIWVWRLGRWRWWAGGLAVGLVAAMQGLPLYGLLWRAGRVGEMTFSAQGPRWSWKGLGQSILIAAGDLAGPMGTSLIWGALAASLAVVVAWGLAWACRESRGWFWGVLAAALMAFLLGVPAPVMGMGLVLGYQRFSVVYDTPAIVVMGLVGRTLPFAMAILWVAMRSIPKPLLESAMVDGYGPWGLIRRVALPQTRMAVAAAWGTAFVLAMGELPVTNLVAPPGVNPLSVLVWGLLHTGVESHLAGVGLLLLLVYGGAGLLASLVVGQWLRVQSRMAEGAGG